MPSSTCIVYFSEFEDDAMLDGFDPCFTSYVEGYRQAIKVAIEAAKICDNVDSLTNLLGVELED